MTSRFDAVAFARALINIDSTTGKEREAGDWLARELGGLGYTVVEQSVDRGCANIVATIDAPHVVLSTHYDCVPPFFPSRVEDGRIYGRGACDAKGILAAQVAAAERLRSKGERRVGLLFVVGEERGSDGAAVANAAPAGSRFLINGEPTDNRLGTATRGVLRLRLRAVGRAAHSAAPEHGESAIDKVIDALVALRSIPLPSDPEMGSTFYSVGLIEGGVAPNVISPHATAEVLFRTIGPPEDILKAMTDNNVRSGVMAITERRTDIPEHSDLTPNEYWDRRARGLGAMPQRPAVSGAEESALRSGRSLFDGKHPHPRIRARGSRDGDEHD